MSLNSIFQYFVPKDKKFFPLFEQAGNNLIEMSKLLKDIVNSSNPEKEKGINTQSGRFGT
jgi:hypothetical protein